MNFHKIAKQSPKNRAPAFASSGRDRWNGNKTDIFLVICWPIRRQSLQSCWQFHAGLAANLLLQIFLLIPAPPTLCFSLSPVLSPGNFCPADGWIPFKLGLTSRTFSVGSARAILRYLLSKIGDRKVAQYPAACTDYPLSSRSIRGLARNRRAG